MQVDFYYLTRDPAEKLVPTLASKCLDANARVLLVSASAEQRTSLSKALWTHTPASFLANDFEGSEHEKDQPILIADGCNSVNDANYVIIGDGVWRENALDFERAFWAEPLMEAQFRQLVGDHGSDGISNSLRGYGKTSFTDTEHSEVAHHE